MLSALISFGYPDTSAEYITVCVVELTDVFTKAAFPELKKDERKQKETARLIDISPDAQTVKYADLIYNIDWMLRFGGEKLPNYLKRKQTLLEQLSDGDEVLGHEVQALILKSQNA